MIAKACGWPALASGVAMVAAPAAASKPVAVAGFIYPEVEWADLQEVGNRSLHCFHSQTARGPAGRVLALVGSREGSERRWEEGYFSNPSTSSSTCSTEESGYALKRTKGTNFSRSRPIATSVPSWIA